MIEEYCSIVPRVHSRARRVLEALLPLGEKRPLLALAKAAFPEVEIPQNKMLEATQLHLSRLRHRYLSPDYTIVVFPGPAYMLTHGRKQKRVKRHGLHKIACPTCGNENTSIVRSDQLRGTIRRERVCAKGHKFFTAEVYCDSDCNLE